MKTIKGLIQLFADDYNDAKRDMKENSPETPWLFLAIGVLFILAHIIEAL